MLPREVAYVRGSSARRRAERRPRVVSVGPWTRFRARRRRLDSTNQQQRRPKLTVPFNSPTEEETMPSMPTYHVNKGSQFGFLDTTLGGANFRTELDAVRPGCRVRIRRRSQHRGARTCCAQPAHAKRLRPFRPGLARRGGWWPQNAVPDTLRAGFTKAIEHAKARQLPMEVLWVCARDPDFHVYYCEGPRQVTVLVFSPHPADTQTCRSITARTSGS